MYFFLSWSRCVGDWGISTQLGKGSKTALLFLFCFIFAACYQQDELILKVFIENKFWISSALVNLPSLAVSVPNIQAPSFENLTAEGAASLWMPRSQPQNGAARRAPAHSARLKEASNCLVVLLLLKTLSVGCGVIRCFPKCKQAIKKWGVAFWK